ncbi:Pycsar system effector family protein [Brevibacterium aurantiacum]|uniref:Pycsar effector protein domain-containing protein n=1 Tax=Brevibacterium aurantiacum TaxID=273384 RepID=A0A556CFG0_BREAU|nr:Pycsar system effector family protein [Brevibacterium aurantiacum]TSI16185.1 hypothetical protein FO013_11230 [Brevibacterium aurantiacum]
MTRKSLRRRRAAALTAPSPQPNPDQAWKLLGLINEWIRHSDAKAAVTLAFSGVLGTMIFNLVNGFEHRTPLFGGLVVLASLLLVATVSLCAWTLTPRVNDKDADPQDINRIFFASITRHFEGARPRFQGVLNELTANPGELINDLADQIHANAKISTIKAKYVKWAIRAALATSAAVACLAVLVGLSNF